MAFPIAVVLMAAVVLVAGLYGVVGNDVDTMGVGIGGW